MSSLSGKPDLIPSLNCLTIDCLQEHKEFFIDELDPLHFCDLLFEERALDILTHDIITETKMRQKQMKFLLETLREIKNDCFHFFLYILQRDEYDYIRTQLEKPAFEAIETSMYIFFSLSIVFMSC